MIAALLLGCLLAQDDPQIQVPDGFVVEKIAGSPLVERPIMAGFDDQGRLYVGDSAGVNLKFDDLVKSPPHRILRLEDTKGTGVFDKSVVFADKLTFPMGALWYRGSLYVCAPPSVWKLTDTDGDGVADKREEIVTRFGSNGNAADIHGPFLGPDGWFYWTDGRHGHRIDQPDGSRSEGSAARVFRSRPDGTQVEVVCGGGMDNPVEIAFTEEGEPLVTCALFQASPKRVDVLFHAIEGGVFPYHESLREFKRTGDLLPSVVDLGWVAPSGLMRYRGEAFGKEYTNTFFSAQFNTHKVQRHLIERDGATFRGRTEEFLVSANPDFHPTDVLEDADGSLIVIDTGGWFRIGCPTSRIDKPQIKGGIYRVRRKGAPRTEDPWGQTLDWRKPPIERFEDPRFAVRDRMVETYVEATAAAAAERRASEWEVLLTHLKDGIANPSVTVRRNMVWAMARSSGPPEDSSAVGIDDPDASVRIAAVHVAGLKKPTTNPTLKKRLIALLADPVPAVRREAATALGRLRARSAVPALLDALRAGADRFLEHALIYALIRIDDRDGTVDGLNDPNPNVRRAALIALDQMDHGALTRDQVTPLLDPANLPLQQAALSIVAARGWSGELMGLLREWLAAEQPPPEAGAILTTFAKDPGIQDLLAQALRSPKTSTATRLVLLETVARAPLDHLPATWTAELRWSLDHADHRVVRQAVAALRAGSVPDFDPSVLSIAKDPARPEDLRVDALVAVAPRLAKLESGLFGFLRECVDQEKPALLRLAAAQALGSAALSNDQLFRLASTLGTVGALELPRLLGAYEHSDSAKVGHELIAWLEKSPAIESLPAEALRRALQSYPDEIRARAAPILKRLEVDTEKQKARLEELGPLLTGGDPSRGKDVFFGKKVACSTCHTIQSQGGRVGPDLSKIASIRTGRDLLESIVFPSASFARGYEPYLIRTKDGAILDGLIARETADAVYLFTADRTEKRVPRASIDLMQMGKTSIMPQGLDAQIARDELRDLLAYLLSLK
ncbi:MAG TPA: PVC-type heme-binding CxxCH protein [Planctomycetota bacterium]|nr:PVC-type heme-binding CxxCH protein [Planctomycetota bacterium]